MEIINNFFAELSNFLWGNFGVANLVIGGGVFFLIYSKLTPFRYFKHAFEILLGKHDDPDDEGQISHFQALSTALSSTVGIGNIAGVAVAISLGGPGALFWMWISAIVGMATKFFTCSLGIMYRGYDSDNVLQGGPMYVLEQGMGKKFKFLSLFIVSFAIKLKNPISLNLDFWIFPPKTSPNNWQPRQIPIKGFSKLITNSLMAFFSFTIQGNCFIIQVSIGPPKEIIKENCDKSFGMS